MMIEQEYPRVLIVNGDPLSLATATGITLHNLFEGWPAERLAQIFRSPIPRERRGVIEHELCAGDKLGCGFLWAAREAWRNRNISVKGGISGNAPGAWGAGAQSPCRSLLRKWMDLLPYGLPAELEKAVLQFRPEVVYTCLGNISIAALALQCATLSKAPVVPHFLDDWMSTMYQGRPDLIIQRCRLRKVVSNVVKNAPVGMAISDAMSAEYGPRYGIAFHTFMNCEPVPHDAKPEPEIRENAGLRIVYVGGLHLDRWRSLKEVGNALTILNAEGIPVRLFIYAPRADIAEFGARLTMPTVEVVGSLSKSDVQPTLASGHILLHVESFEPSARKYTRLSISTKIPQYMAAARPLFCYGPGEVASCRFVKGEGCGVVVGAQGQHRLVEALRTILKDTERRKVFAERALAVAKHRFETVSVRSRFRSVLAEAAWGGFPDAKEPLSRMNSPVRALSNSPSERAF